MVVYDSSNNVSYTLLVLIPRTGTYEFSMQLLFLCGSGTESSPSAAGLSVTSNWVDW